MNPDPNQQPAESAEPPSLHVVGKEPRQPVRLKTSWTAADLMATDFPEPKWAVPGLLPEGVSLLAGPPKVGKSWMSLGTALAVASGELAFGAIPTEPGPVLYLALEDTPRRLKSRMGKILGDSPAPAALTLATVCPPLPQGGDEAIASWLDRNPDARMVVIDVFAKLRGISPPGMSAYDADYAAVGRAKRLADDYGVAVVLVHHVRKAGSDDFLTEVSGTNGLAGAADSTLVLKRGRGQADAVLHVTGRDVDEAEHAMTFDASVGSWSLHDQPAEYAELGDTRVAIARFLRANPGSGPTAIAKATGLKLDNVKRTVSCMRDAGQLAVDGGGRYRVPDPESHPGVTPVTPVTEPPLTS